jgi:uncharacterized protein
MSVGMSPTNYNGALGTLAAIVICLALLPARAEADHAAIAREALQHVIRPGYAALAKAARRLKIQTESLCDEPSTPALEAAKEAFVATVGAWSQVEILRFGPIIQDHRYERLFYWPDAKSIGLRQVQQALAKRDATVTDPARLAAKSVALQGLPALEYLFYGDDADQLADGDSSATFRCHFAASVAANIDAIATAVESDWGEDAAFTNSFLEPGSDSPNYRAPKEVTLELFKALTSGIELVRDQKIARPLAGTAHEAKPKLAAFWRSGLTFANMAGNLEGVRTLFALGGFAEVVAQESAGVEKSILFDLDHSISVLRGIEAPADQVFRDPASRSKLQAVRVALKSARDTVGDMIARGAGLSFGFNAMDGD